MKGDEKNGNLLELVKKKSRKYFRQNIPISYKFHRYTYFKKVVKTAKKIAQHANLSEEEEEVLLLANWFRFTGMAKKYQNFHQDSADFAVNFLQKQKYSPLKTEKVKALILSMRPDAEPTGKLAKISHDAAFAYIGRKSFFNKVSLLRIELEEIEQKLIKAKEWEEYQFNLLTKAHFYTQYANQKYQKTQADNIRQQRKKKQKATTAAIRKKTGKEFGRGIDTLYRTTYRNHINLSSIADGKANMMISINTIILSAIVTLLATSLTLSGQVSFQHFRFFIPVLILLAFVLISAVLAILSAKPKVTHGTISTSDIINRTKSVLFFGNFINLDRDEFVENMDLLKRNQELLYDNMAVDIYYLGHVLDRKYKLIKHSYNIFMVGLILCVTSFLFILIYSQITSS